MSQKKPMKAKSQKKQPNRQILSKGAQAAALVADPFFQEVVGIVRQSYIDRMINTEPADDAGRAHFRNCIHALNDIQTVLTGMESSANYEKMQVAKLKKGQAQ